jgi:hypothetical protein
MGTPRNASVTISETLTIQPEVDEPDLDKDHLFSIYLRRD